MSPTENLLWMAAIWTAIAAGVAYFFPNWVMRIVFVLAAVAIPFWEFPYGYYNFQRLCAEELGVKIFEPISPQKSICREVHRDSYVEQWLAPGMDFVEARDRQGNVTRLERGKGPVVLRSKTDALASEYCVGSDWINNLPWGINRHEYWIRKNSSQAVVARLTSQIHWSGMSWQKSTRAFGSGGSCHVRGSTKAIVDLALRGSDQ
jgi:hypothetical protein